MTYEAVEKRSSWPFDQTLSDKVGEQEDANKQLEAIPTPDAGSVDIRAIRKFRLYNADGSFKPKLLAQGVDQKIGVADRAVFARVFSADPSKGIYLHFHGGGWVMGSIHEQEELLWNFSQSTELTVVSVDYPLAPETRLDNIIEFVGDAARIVMDEFPEQPFFIGGESAGSHLAMSALLSMVNEPNRLARVCALNFCYGIYDLSMTPSQTLWGDRMLGLSTPYLEWFYELALPGQKHEERRDARVSPLYHPNLVGLPPALFTVGEYDPLLDDSLFMASRWRAAGNKTQLKVYPKAPHGFNGLPTGMARTANDEISKFIRSSIPTKI